jgi:RND family efflux transporter MFP subunit
MKGLPKILLPVALLALGLGGRAWLMATSPQMPSSQREHAVPAVETVEARVVTRRLAVSAMGEIQPRIALTLAAEAAGRVVWLAPALDVGGTCAAGDELLRLDDVDARQRIAAAAAEVERARAHLAMEEAAAASALADWRELGEGEASALARREPQVALARASLAAADAAAAAAATALERCTVRAPLDARTARRLVEAGAVIAPGTPLAVLHAAREFEVRLPLTLSDLDLLGFTAAAGHQALPVELRAAFGASERAWAGEMTAVEPALDPRDRTAFGVVCLRLAPGDLPPPAGLFVHATIRGRNVEGVVELPRSALHPQDMVLVVDAESRLRWRDVGLVQRTADAVLVRGLADGERVCVLPPPITAEGMLVQVIVGAR